ncbi:hypothetical protein WOLCODRAFT_20816 [Wolfiporia cocos MD-104 SS10]|uniref:Uncharacterized protein n=1 Tax=Wolfiporia cocos (strain MD-104) TaxID=742152 RepID=A0A2H3JDV8_WOLCO|nr:hypothetical protein WOLCODRAFT_20816 [Wolfiporia cocos MD-104 SS10]
MPQQFQNMPQASGVAYRVDSDLSAGGKSSQTTRNRQARKRPRSSSASRAERMISMPPLQQPTHSSDQLPISSTQSLSNMHTLRLRGGRSLPTHSMTDAMARNEPVGGEMLMCTADTDTGLRLKVAISYAQQQHKEAPWYFPWMHILQRQLSFELSTGTSTSVIALPFPQLPVDAEVDTYENPWDWTVDQAAGNQLGATVAVYESGGSDEDSEEDLAGNLEEYLAATVDDLNGAMRQSLSPDPLALDCLPDDLRENIGRCIHNRQTSSLSPGILHSNKRQSLSPDPLLLGCRPDSIQQLSSLGVSSSRGGTPVPSNVGAIAPLQNALRLSRRIPDFTVKMFRTTCNSDGNIVIEKEQTILIAEIKPAIKDSENLSEIRRHLSMFWLLPLFGKLDA